MRKGIYGYTYLRHIINLWTGYWDYQLLKVNAAIGDKNKPQKELGKTQPVRIYSKNEFWKCIGCIHLVVKYGRKENIIWLKGHIYEKGNNKSIIDRDIFGKTYKKVLFHIYNFNCYYFFCLTMLSYTGLYIYCICL